MQDQSEKLKAARGQAQRRVDEICRLVLDSTTASEPSLVACLVRAYRAGHDETKALDVFTALETLISEARDTYIAAIRQPEPKARTSPRVVL